VISLLKKTVHPTIKILSSFTHPHIDQNLSSVNTKEEF